MNFIETIKTVCVVILVELYTLASLWLARFCSLSVIRYHENEEVDRNKYYMYALMHFVFLLGCFLITFTLIVAFTAFCIQRVFYKDKQFMECTKIVYTFVVQYFNKKEKVLWIGLLLLLVISFVLSITYIDTGNDFVNGYHQQQIDIKEEHDEQEDNDTMSSEKTGIAYVFKLVEFISMIDFILIPLCIFMVALN